MKKINKIIISLSATLLFAAGMATGVAASGNLTEIKAFINKAISIVYNGEKQVLKDANGVEVYPLTYNGTTYVPLRAISNIFGEPVSWYGPTSSVIIGSAEKQPVDLIAEKGYTRNKYTWQIRESEKLKVTGNEGEVTFKNGIIYDIWNGSASVMNDSLVGWDIPTGYTKITFTAWASIDSKVELYAKDKKTVITTFEIKANQPVFKELDVTDIDYVSFGANATSPGTKGELRIFEPTLQ